jgi:2-polyprenyl-6-methoxyphenol hydroxylase-like FAD-dependent oxidoreductase
VTKPNQSCEAHRERAKRSKTDANSVTSRSAYPWFARDRLAAAAGSEQVVSKPALDTLKERVRERGRERCMRKTAEVVVVGGGIAGSALATVLAGHGFDVLVLERQTTYRDKVRGEGILLWGVAELLRLGLEDAFLAAGGCYVTRTVPYDELLSPAEAEAVATSLDQYVPGVPGMLTVGHPQACEALGQAASAAGASVLRGIADVRVQTGKVQRVRYTLDGVEHEVRCRLLVGADGRQSTVRRQLGIGVAESVPRTMGGGMLVKGLSSWPNHQVALGTEGDLYYFIFPRANGWVRLYLIYDIRQKHRFKGPNRQAEFLDAYRLRCIPGSEEIAAAKPAGPCVFYPMNDMWTDTPYVNGAVLIGDAAGYNDPILGQGLSIALRDVSIVADLLCSGSDWSVTAFAPYGEERRERMRRLRITATVFTDLRATFTPQGAARRKRWNQVWQSDPLLSGLALTPMLGPQQAPAEAFEPQVLDRILALC